jgi:hypothetical protein
LSTGLDSFTRILWCSHDICISCTRQVDWVSIKPFGEAVKGDFYLGGTFVPKTIHKT